MTTTAPTRAPREDRAAPGKKPKPKLSPRLRKLFGVLPPDRVARACKVSRQAVAQWQDVPAKHAIRLEAATEKAGTKLAREFLAPGFYPRPTAKLPRPAAT